MIPRNKNMAEPTISPVSFDIGLFMGIIIRLPSMLHNNKNSTHIQLSTLKLNLWIPFYTNKSFRKSVIFDVRIFFSAIENLLILLASLFSIFSFDRERDFLLFVVEFKFLESLFQKVHLLIISSGLDKFLLEFFERHLVYCRKLHSDLLRIGSTLIASSEQSKNKFERAVLFFLSFLEEIFEVSYYYYSWDSC